MAVALPRQHTFLLFLIVFLLAGLFLLNSWLAKSNPDGLEGFGSSILCSEPGGDEGSTWKPDSSVFDPVGPVQQCHGLILAKDAASLRQCERSCLHEPCCETWQFHPHFGCWTGHCEMRVDGDPTLVWHGSSSQKRIDAFNRTGQRDPHDLGRFSAKSCSPHGRVGTTSCSWKGPPAPGFFRLASDGTHLWGHGNFLLSFDDPVYIAEAEQALAIKYAGPFELYAHAGRGGSKEDSSEDTYILSFNPDYFYPENCGRERFSFDIFRSITQNEYESLLGAEQLLVRWQGSAGSCLMDWSPELMIQPEAPLPRFFRHPATAAVASSAPLCRANSEPNSKIKTSPNASDSVPRLGICYSEFIWTSMEGASSPGRLLRLLQVHMEYHFEKIGVSFFDVYGTACDIARIRATGALASLPVNFVEWNHMFNETEYRMRRPKSRYFYQARQYKDCAVRHRFENSWLLFIDVDEYVVTFPLSNPHVIRWDECYKSCFGAYQASRLGRRTVRLEGDELFWMLEEEHEVWWSFKVLANADVIRHIEVHWASRVDVVFGPEETQTGVRSILPVKNCPALLHFHDLVVNRPGGDKEQPLSLSSAYKDLTRRIATAAQTDHDRGRFSWLST